MASSEITRVNLLEKKYESLAQKGILLLDEEINEAVANMFYTDVMYLLSNGFDKPMWILLNSPGGEVDQGFAIYDTIRMVAESGRQIHIVGKGLIASMAVSIMQAGVRRYSFPHTQFLVHQVSRTMNFFGSEEVSQARDRTEELERINDINLSLISQRSGKPLDEIKRECKKTDVWLDSKKALLFGDHGLIDEICTIPPYFQQLIGS